MIIKEGNSAIYSSNLDQNIKETAQIARLALFTGMASKYHQGSVGNFVQLSNGNAVIQLKNKPLENFQKFTYLNVICKLVDINSEEMLQDYMNNMNDPKVEHEAFMEVCENLHAQISEKYKVLVENQEGKEAFVEMISKNVANFIEDANYADLDSVTVSVVRNQLRRDLQTAFAPEAENDFSDEDQEALENI